MLRVKLGPPPEPPLFAGVEAPPPDDPPVAGAVTEPDPETGAFCAGGCCFARSWTMNCSMIWRSAGVSPCGRASPEPTGGGGGTWTLEVVVPAACAPDGTTMRPRARRG